MWMLLPRTKPRAFLQLARAGNNLPTYPCVSALRGYADDKESDKKPGSFVNKLWKAVDSLGKSNSTTPEIGPSQEASAQVDVKGSDVKQSAEDSQRPESEKTPSASTQDEGSSGSALILSDTRPKHREVYVVELQRKPLFPGIYTPVTIHNEKLIKEIMDIKKQGAQAYLGAFLRRPEGIPLTHLHETSASSPTPSSSTPPSSSSSSSSSSLTNSLEDASGKVHEKEMGSNFVFGDGQGLGEWSKEKLKITKVGASDFSTPSSSSGEPDPMGHLYEVGTFAQVHTLLTGDTSDTAQLLLLGHRRIRRKKLVSSDPAKVQIEHLKDDLYTNNDILKATSMELMSTMRELLHLNPLYGEQLRTLISLTGSIDLQDMSRLVDAAASLASAEDVELQTVLEQLEVPERARAVLLLLKKEVELCKLQANIREQMEAKMMKEQRRMMLMEQLKTIKKELGLEKDDKTALIQRFTQRWEGKKARAPEDAVRVVGDELEKLSSLEMASPEFNVTRNYLDWLTILPWGEQSQELFDLAYARQVLDEDHYGLEDVKERILEFIAVSGLRGTAQGKILCLVGPPGVGKTSIGRSIARTLARKYYRFSVGGLYDVAEIKGHRRTYVGAMPGKMVQCLKSTQTSNPLVLIDEIDKLGRGHQGDPASALLELLDPEQNSGFVDHYLDVPVDLSKVLFVCTANVLDTIPGPLLDRMEVIRLSGYASAEKVAIARRYLEPQAAADAGVAPGQARLTDEALQVLIEEYCREAGVRNLKKQLEKVYRKVALKLFKSQGPPAATPLPNPSSTSTPLASSSSSSTSLFPPTSPSVSHDGSQQVQEQVQTTAEQASPADPLQERQSTAEGADSAVQDAKKPREASASEAEAINEEKKEPWQTLVIDKDTLKDYVGQPPFAQDRIYDVTPPGVVMGLAWTSMGGAILYIEAAKVHEGDAKGSLITTGQLGDVFRESTRIAHTFARTYLAALDPENKFFMESAVHLHVPQGSIPKDGPSAGCALVTSLLGLALKRSAAPDLAMTGELTLTGRVLPIGGVKEKVLAAKRAGVKNVIFPKGNKHDYEELADELKTGLTPHFVATYDEVFQIALQSFDGSVSTEAELKTD